MNLPGPFFTELFEKYPKATELELTVKRVKEKEFELIIHKPK